MDGLGNFRLIPHFAFLVHAALSVVFLWSRFLSVFSSRDEESFFFLSDFGLPVLKDPLLIHN